MPRNNKEKPANAGAPLPEGLKLRGAVYQIDIYHNGKRIRKSTGTNDPVEAVRQYHELRDAIRLMALTGIEPEVLKPKVLLADFVSRVLDHLASERAAKTTLAKYRAHMATFGTFLEAKLKREPALTDITPELVGAYRAHAAATPRTANGLEEGPRKLPSPRTIAGELDTIRRFMRRAVELGHLDRNPEAGVGRPRNAYAGRIRWLTDDEAERLLEAAATWDAWAPSERGRRPEERGPILGLVIDLYLRTGLRAAELRYLTLEDALARSPGGGRVLNIRARSVRTEMVKACSRETFEAYLANIAETAKKPPPGKRRRRKVPDLDREQRGRATWDGTIGAMRVPLAVDWRPKTKDRMVPLSRGAQELIGRILEWRQAYLAEDHPDSVARRALDIEEPPWLVPSRTGTPWGWAMHTVMSRCCERAGITPKARTHDLRHTFATRLRRKGINIETIKEFLGHSDIADTMIYAHFDMREGFDAIDAADP